MVGILLSYWGGLFSGAMLVSGRVHYDETHILSIWDPIWTRHFRLTQDSRPTLGPPHLRFKGAAKGTRSWTGEGRDGFFGFFGLERRTQIHFLEKKFDMFSTWHQLESMMFPNFPVCKVGYVFSFPLEGWRLFQELHLQRLHLRHLTHDIAEAKLRWECPRLTDHSGCWGEILQGFVG